MNDPQTLKKNWMMFSCQQTWPEYQLRDEERWFLEGNINHHAILQLDFFHQEFKKKSLSSLCSSFFGFRDKSSLHFKKCHKD